MKKKENTNLRLYVNDISYTVEVLYANVGIPVNEIMEFIDWLKKQPLTLGLGKFRLTYECKNSRLEIKLEIIISG